ncbi:MAG: hypothetical protein AB7O28_26940 [Vicinamibacterales bacterium]
MTTLQSCVFASVASALLLQPTVAAAQSRGASTRDGASITAVGCISPAVHDGSLSGGPGVPPATPNTAPILANSAQPTGVFLLSGATAPDATAEDRQHLAAGHPAKDEGVTYELEGMSSEVERHKGQLVEVTGTLSLRSRGGEAETRTPVHHLRLASVKAVSPKCPAAKTP